jgi:PAS domain S-box-containing protein
MTSQTKGAPHQISNSIHRLLLESSMAGYWDWHIPSNEEYLSPRFKSMFGYEDHELPNSPESWQKLIFQDDLSLLLEQFDAHVSSKGEIPLAVTVRYRHKNGSVVHVKWNDH